MVIPILSTKLHIPMPPSGMIPRPQLVDQLDTGAQKRFILISAPAGFGKSSLLAAWVALPAGKRRIAWVHLDDHDNELNRFLSYVIAALQTCHRDLGVAALAGLQSIPPVPLEATLASLINEIASLEDELILILDARGRTDAVVKARILGLL